MQTDNLMSIKIKVHSGYRGSSEEFSGWGGDRLDKISIKSTSTIFYRSWQIMAYTCHLFL